MRRWVTLWSSSGRASCILYALQAVAEGVSSVIAAGAMVVDAVYFNMVGRAPYWYTQSELTTVVEVRHVLQSGLQLEEISVTNKLPLACNRLDATRKRAVKIATQEHEAIMEEEAGRRDRLEVLRSARTRTAMTSSRVANRGARWRVMTMTIA